MIGTLINTVAILAGPALGLLLRKGIPERMRETVMQGLALCVVLIGVSGAVKTGEVELVAGIALIPIGLLLFWQEFKVLQPEEGAYYDSVVKIDLSKVEMAAVQNDNGYVVEMKIATPYYRKSDSTVAINVQLNNVYAADSDTSNWDTREGGAFGTQPTKHSPMIVSLSTEAARDPGPEYDDYPSQTGDIFAIQQQPAGRDIFQTGDHAQRGGFAAAGGTDEDHELTVLDVQTEVADSFNFTFVHFVHMFEKYFSHFSIP